jgi:hypothetical protein
MLHQNKHRRIFVKMLYFGSFFIASIYNQTSRSFTVWLFLLFYMVLLENKDQYHALQKHLHLKRTRKKSKHKFKSSPFGQPAMVEQARLDNN